MMEAFLWYLSHKAPTNNDLIAMLTHFLAFSYFCCLYPHLNRDPKYIAYPYHSV